jgi:hypothetical protein
VVLAEEEMVLQGMSDAPMETGRCYGVGMNVSKTKVMRISGKQSPVQIMVDKKLSGDCEMLQLCG